MSDVSWDAFMTSGEPMGHDSFVRREYLLPDGRKITYPAVHQPPEGSVFIGLTENHKTPEGKWCGGWIGFTNVAGSDPQSKHELVSAEPLTVTPSLQCRQCSNHGHITNGVWIPC